MKPEIEKIYREVIDRHLEIYREEKGILGCSGWDVTTACQDALLDFPDDAFRRTLLSELFLRLEFVIVGTPGGGTSFMTRLLTELGKPAGHEGVFRPTGVLRTEPLEAGRIVCDVSGFSVQWCRLLPAIPQYRLLRHPVGVVNSCMKHLKWSPRRAWNYWLGVHRNCAQLSWCRVEDCYRSVGKLTRQHPEHVEAVAEGIDRNAHPGRDTVLWDDLPAEVQRLAVGYGYGKEGLTARGGTSEDQGLGAEDLRGL